MRPPKPRLPTGLLELLAKALESFERSDARFQTLFTVSSSRSSITTDAPELESPDRIGKPKPPRYILVLDSSFNPPTLAHQRMVLSALRDPRYSTKMSRVLLLLAINNADKAPKPAAFAQRLAMMYVFAQDILLAAAAGQGGDGSKMTTSGEEMPCDGVDIAVTKEPYFHAKAVAISESETYRAGTEKTQPEDGEKHEQEQEQIYLTGYDTLIRIFDPKYYPNDTMKASLDPFFARARLRVRMRTSDEWGDAAQQIAYLDELRAGKLESVGGRTEWVDRIEMVEGRADDEAVISSTKVRNAVREKDWEALKELVCEDVVAWIRENGLYAEEGK
ncbi:Nucleotidylyl transferase [Xylariaceae sp. FL0594]|nr:Nucleotidylyl transferase [Xylariaceae sp. FL0594]